MKDAKSSDEIEYLHRSRSEAVSGRKEVRDRVLV